MNSWLTDSTNAAARFAGDTVHWRKVVAGEDPVVDLLARTFNPGRESWTDIDQVQNPGRGSVVLIDEAGRSQFDAMLECEQQDTRLPDRIVCLALTGARFRGQRARPWTALRGNLHLTVRYKLDLPCFDAGAAITMIPAIAAAETVTEISDGRLVPVIKWINDVFVQGSKVAGVLAATRITGQTINHVVFGIGMNIDQAPVIQASPFVPSAGHLAGFDPQLHGSLPGVFSRMVDKLDALVGDLQTGRWNDLFERYRDKAGFIGERVCLWPDGTEQWEGQSPMSCGTVLDLLPDLSLVLDNSDQPVRSGRMAYESVWRDFVS